MPKLKSCVVSKSCSNRARRGVPMVSQPRSAKGRKELASPFGAPGRALRIALKRRSEVRFRGVNRKTYARSELYRFWPRLCENSYIVKMQKIEFSSMASNRMSRSIISSHDAQFLQDILRARRALEFSHGLGPEETCRPRRPMSAVGGEPENICSI